VNTKDMDKDKSCNESTGNFGNNQHHYEGPILRKCDYDGYRSNDLDRFVSAILNSNAFTQFS